ncbi:hypothetical protein CLOSTHATH_00111 [Hungatella hathewayi DSM 13479]|uniref:Uncharacterized protein n=1 Tax=Hungatella hathewayi DSM 13479 TaxID=566550 RepID=D3A941_9FIRM|nr:hypothetical protein CLOSTHATH_00111 [Hungatella hathewayi DSM 13479]
MQLPFTIKNCNIIVNSIVLGDYYKKTLSVLLKTLKRKILNLI